VANTLFFKRAIEDYIIATLKAVTGLDDIGVWIRGALPPGISVPQDYFPHGEVWIATEDEFEPFPELTGGLYNTIYDGIINVSVLLTDTANADWIDVVESRVLTLPSYDRVEEYVYYIMSELQKCEHKDLGTLVLNDEAAVELTIVGPRIYGFDRNERTNPWENFGSVPFQVETMRRRA